MGNKDTIFYNKIDHGFYHEIYDEERMRNLWRKKKDMKFSTKLSLIYHEIYHEIHGRTKGYKFL